ncbi:DUF711 family protein [Desulfocicer niacini]
MLLLTSFLSPVKRDTGTMAYRLNKPLTVRLFPAQGLKAGDMTVFAQIALFFNSLSDV